jgi:di/tricarboxylate transporter
MNLAAISLTALVLALGISCVSRVNVGVVAIVFAWVVGVFIGGLAIEQVLAGFPTGLFLTLVALTLLFAQAQVNGTLDRFARLAARACRGNAGVIPIVFFSITALISSIGPGNIAATALMAPLGMAVAGRYGISPFLMAIMVANGASAGSLSPIAPTGVIVNGLVARMGITDVAWPIYINNLLIHAAVALGGYLLLGGLKLFRREGTLSAGPLVQIEAADILPRHWLTLGAIAVLVLCAVVFRANVGMTAFCCALVLTFARAADEGEAIKQIPWGVIMMVTGVTVLVALVERTGGMAIFADFLARLSTPASSTFVTAFFTGLISIYSSTTGVVIPALLPTVPGLVERMGGGDVMAIVSSMNSGGHLVDVSPLSTLGALCLAAAPPGTDTRRLFNQLLTWGLSMTVVGAVASWVLFGLLKLS